jgi:alpha-beta hydrolase superfamily lysophospholipase
MDPSRGHVSHRAFELDSPSGRLAGYAWGTPSPRARAILLHGLGEHALRYSALASDLAVAGIGAWAADLPGHGASPGPRGHASWRALRDEVVPALLAAAHAAPADGSAPLFLVGHSMGGLLALDFALARPQGLAGIVLSAPALEAAEPPSAWKLVLARALNVVAPAARFDAGIRDEQRSRDPEVVRAAGADRAVHPWITPRLYFGLAVAQRRAQAAAATLALPALVVQGEADTVVSPAGARGFARAAPGVGLLTYAGMLHEPFNEIGREAVIRDVVAWMLGRPARGATAVPAGRS